MCRPNRELLPEAAAYFRVVGGEVRPGRAMLAIPERKGLLLGGFFTIAAMVAAMNSVVGGFGAALLVNRLVPDATGLVVATGIASGITVMALALACQQSRHRVVSGPRRRPGGASAGWLRPAGHHEGTDIGPSHRWRCRGCVSCRPPWRARLRRCLGVAGLAD
jgi:hypothetical protein